MAENNDNDTLMSDIAAAYTCLAKTDPTNSLLEMATINARTVLVLDRSFGRNYNKLKGLPAKLGAYLEDLRAATPTEEPRGQCCDWPPQHLF